MPTIPLYDGAFDIKTQDIPRSKTNDVTTRIITYRCNANQQEVLAFYQQVLAREGWRLNSPQTPIPDALYFSISSDVGSRDPVYGVRISAKDLDDRTTDVEINLGEYLAR